MPLPLPFGLELKNKKGRLMETTLFVFIFELN